MPKKPRKRNKKPQWGWKTYLIFFSVAIIQAAIDFFSPESDVYIFLHILIAFDQALKFIYYVNATAVIVNLVNLIPLFFFVYRIKFLTPRFWQLVLTLRVIFDLVGHYYEFVFIKSIFASSPLSALNVTLGILLVTWPSYWACYHYAFRWNKIFPKQMELFKRN